MRIPVIMAALCAAAVVPGAASAQAAYQTGYYDSYGDWVATAPSAGESAANASFEALGTREREALLASRIDGALRGGALSGAEAQDARYQLDSIRGLDNTYRSVTGELTPAERARVDARLDALRDRLIAASGD